MVSMPLRAYLNPACNHIIAGCHHSFNSATKYRRALSSLSSSFIELSSKHSSKYQVYISKTHDPFINLSIEHYLLQKTHADSTILFLYINNPCVVIGRNQNPWLEANFRLLAKQAGGESIAPLGTIQQLENPKQVQLVRRRSGGGAVFHDHGNYNYSVICPSRDFSRDKHLEMVVQAIRHDNDRARINERHDIILDQGPKLSMDSWPDHLDMYRTTYSVENGNHVPLKVSGSAYKLTRERCLHHGTCLIDSQNIDHISMYLRSPVRPFMKARGVESVRTPISNVYGADVENASQRFERQVLGAFANMYRLRRGFMRPFNRPTAHRQLEHDEDWVSGYVTNALAEIPEIRSGIRELQSPDWIYGQTPQFVLSSYPTADDDRVRPCLPSRILSSARVNLVVRSGVVDLTRISLSADPDVADREMKGFDKVLTGLSIHKIQDFYDLFQHVEEIGNTSRMSSLATWLNEMFGKV